MNACPVKYVLCLLSLTVCLSVFAKEDLDLKRITPVPADRPIPTMDFVRRKFTQDAVLNKAGTHIAAIISTEDEVQQLWVLDVATQRVTEVRLESCRGVHGLRWLGDSRLMFFSGIDLCSTDLDNLAKVRVLTRGCMITVVGVPEKDPLHPLVWLRRNIVDQGKDYGVVRLNTDLDERSMGSMVATNWTAAYDEILQRHIITTLPKLPEGLGFHYMADKQGELAFGFAEKDGILVMYRLVGDHWEKCPVDTEKTYPLAPGNKPGEMIVLQKVTADSPRALQLMDAATGQMGEVLLQDKAYDFDGRLFRDPVTLDVMGVFYQRSGPQAIWFSEPYRALQKHVDKLFPGVMNRILSKDRAGRRLLVSTYSDRQPAAFYLVDLEKRSIALFIGSEPWTDVKRMQPMNMLKFKTRDGRSMDAYVTLPAGASKKSPAPLIVMPAPGFGGRHTWCHEDIAQFLASRGYAVLQPNHRGAAGSEWLFPEEDKWAFNKMAADVNDATKTLVASGLVDGRRIAIAGWSFGAYLALAGILDAPDLYRCAITNSGIFDWAQLIKSESFYRYSNPTYDRLMLKLGDPKKEQEKFEALSPASAVEQLKVPLLVTGSRYAADPLWAQSRAFVDKLKKTPLPHEYITTDYGSTVGQWLEQQVELFNAMDAFLAKNFASVPAAVPGAAGVAK